VILFILFVFIFFTQRIGTGQSLPGNKQMTILFCHLFTNNYLFFSCSFHFLLKLYLCHKPIAQSWYSKGNKCVRQVWRESQLNLFSLPLSPLPWFGSSA